MKKKVYETEDDGSDNTYEQSDYSQQSNDEEDDLKPTNFYPLENSSFIVFWSCLLTLFNTLHWFTFPTNAPIDVSNT